MALKDNIGVRRCGNIWNDYAVRLSPIRFGVKDMAGEEEEEEEEGCREGGPSSC